MFKEIFLFELKYVLRKPAVYIYFSVLFLLTLMIGFTISGLFETTRSDSNTVANSALAVGSILLGTTSSIFSILISVLIISISATAIQKDYQYNMHALFFTKPITKAAYFWGRFGAAILATLFVFTGLLLGFMIGILPGLDSPVMGPFKFINFLQPFLLFTIPNVLFLGILFFSLTTYLRTTMAAYIVAIVLMMVQILSNTITAEIDNKMLAAILEPSGASALQYITEYWSPVEKNSRLIPFEGALLYNRLLWLGIAIVIGGLSYRGFSFTQSLKPIMWFRRKEEIIATVEPSLLTLSDLPAVTQNFTNSGKRKQLWYLTMFEFKKMTGSLFFIIMAALGIGMMVLVVQFIDTIYGASTYMVTYKVIENVVDIIQLFALIFVIFYSGTSVWRERESKMDELVGTAPISNGTLFFSKFLGLALSIGLLYLIASIAGIVIQLYSGFYQIDLMQYIVSIFTNIIYGIVLIGLSVAVQVYSPNKYLGFFLALLPVVILPIVFGLLEVDNDLLDFNSTGGGRPYSDMNGYGGSFNQWPFYRLYWISIVAFLSLLAILVYPRGKEINIKKRWKLSAYFNTNAYKGLMTACLLIALVMGGFIYYQTKVLQVRTEPKVAEKNAADTEKKYKRFQSLPQPRIMAVSLEADIFTADKRLEVKGSYVLLNKTGEAIDTLYFDYAGGKKSPYHFRVFDPSVPFTVVSDDAERGIRILRLNKSLMPGDSILFAFDMYYEPRGLFDRINSPVVNNGTFINNGILPTVGYNANGELSQNKARKEYGLAPKPRMAAVDDSAARMNNYISNDADWIRFDVVLSTDKGQTAIAPGYLQKTWEKDNRQYFKYAMDSPILNFYSFLSADYSLKKDKWKDVNIEIYYHKGHEYNLDRMISAIKKSLDYYTVQFGPYQHRQVRILEFPRYSSFAQSFPNTIPYSEGIGFITKVGDGPDDIDVPFYVTAHEVAHQWWAHQVIGGNVQGSVLMSETMSQYSALMVMEKLYGSAAMKKFLKDEMDKYLLGRATEGRGELPLMLCENQQYIHYNKGSVVMYALKDFLGEEKLNGAISRYLKKTKFSGPIYTNSIEFVDSIKAVTPDSLMYLVEDMFEKITLYENYVKALSFKQQPDKTYKVSLTVGSSKYYADSVGKETKVAVKDYMDIGIFGVESNDKNKDKPLVFQRIKMDQPEKTFEFVVKEKPISAGIDPYLKLIDRTPANNNLKFGEKPKLPSLDKKGNTVTIKVGG